MKIITSWYIPLIGLFLLFNTVRGFSQEYTTEIDSVTKTIRNYFEGYIERDSLKLSKAFDIENGTMKVPIEQNGTITGYENKYFKNLLNVWSNRPKLSNEELKACNLRILNIDLESDQIGTAKIAMKVIDITYVDFLSLQRISGQWKITNKIYIVE